MKKFLLLLGLLGLCTLGYAQVPVTQTLPGPYTGSPYVFQTTSGKEIRYDLIYTPQGIVYAVFDISIAQADLTNAMVLIQSQVSTGQLNSPKVIPLIVPGVVATGDNLFSVRTLADFTVNNGGSGSTLATIPNLLAWVQPNSTYHFKAVLYTATGAGGSKVDIGGPVSPTNVIAQVTGLGAAAVVYSPQVTSFLSGPAGSATAVTQIIIEGTFTTNNGGIFVIQFAQSSANAANSTVKAGSTLDVQQIP